MKNSIIIVLIVLGQSLYGQNDSIEKALIFKKIIANELTQEEFSKMGLKWNQTIKSIGKYPEIPLDQNDQVHYSFRNSFKDFNKEKLFSRTLEWLSIYYSLIPVDFYWNREDGKIIFSNSVDLSANQSCLYTCIITIKDEKIWIEIVNVGYQTFYAGYYSNGNWVHENKTYANINQVYPVILKNSSQWLANLNLLKSTNEVLNTDIMKLNNYIINYDSTYMF